MEKYCKSCRRVFKNSDFKICPYCGSRLATRMGRQPIPRKLRHQVFRRDGYRCRECGATNKQTRLHVDHIVPVSKGGTNELSNLQTLCETCNLSKYTDEWVGGAQYNYTNKNYSHGISDDLYNINKKQREINLSKHLEKQKRTNLSSTQVNNYENVENIFIEPKHELDPVCSNIIQEFKLCNDINIVSKKVGVPAIEIKRWYRQGKRGGSKYAYFYEVLSDLNPNMKIKGFDLDNLSQLDKLNYIASSFKRYEDIKLVSEHTGVTEIQIRKWYKLGKRGQWPYKIFHDKVSNLWGNK